MNIGDAKDRAAVTVDGKPGRLVFVDRKAGRATVRLASGAYVTVRLADIDPAPTNETETPMTESPAPAMPDWVVADNVARLDALDASGRRIDQHRASRLRSVRDPIDQALDRLAWGAQRGSAVVAYVVAWPVLAGDRRSFVPRWRVTCDGVEAIYEGDEIPAPHKTLDDLIADIRGSATPVGIPEIADRLGVKRATVDQWRYRDEMPAPRWVVGGRPAWEWADIQAWARETGRIK